MFRLAVLEEDILGETASVCSRCLKAVPATIVAAGDQVFLRKRCEEHGEETVLESNGRAFYRVAQSAAAGLGGACCSTSSSSNCGAGSDVAGNDLKGEPLGPSCVLLLEITDVCNLECPLCFAASGPAGRFFMTQEEALARIDGVVQKRGTLDIVMLSGGEPTAHPRFQEILAAVAAHPHVKRVMLNTNGVLLAAPGKTREAITQHREKLELYLQFDSLRAFDAERYRGDAGLLAKKRDVVCWLESEEIPVTLAAAIGKEATASSVAELLRFALSSNAIRGVTFQPTFASGRHALPFDPMDRVTTPDVVRLVCEALPDVFAESGFTNLPCSHPNCAIVAYYYRKDGMLWPLCEDIQPEESLKNRIKFNLEDLRKCGCETTELGRYVASAELSSASSFRIVVKPFMDRFTLNRDRSARCCTHIAGPGGRTMSFCEYNIFRSELGWNRNASPVDEN